MKGVYFKVERTEFDVHIVRIKEKGIREIGKNFLRIMALIISCKSKIK